MVCHWQVRISIYRNYLYKYFKFGCIYKHPMFHTGEFNSNYISPLFHKFSEE